MQIRNKQANTKSLNCDVVFQLWAIPKIACELLLMTLNTSWPIELFIIRVPKF